MAVVLTALVIAGRLALDPYWGRQHNRHLVFLPTVMLAAWFGGLGPGLLAAGICTLALDYFWTAPFHSFVPPTPELVLFFVIAIALCGLVESLRMARARADAAAKSREQVLAVVAHDLRSPLATLRLTCAALQKASVEARPTRRQLAVVDQAVGRMESLIRDLVDANRIEHGGITLSIRQEDVKSVVQETVDLFSPQARENHLSIVTDVRLGDTQVACDRNRLMQVFGNIVSNALRFTPEGGTITLVAEEEDGAVRFEVRDTGSGINAEHVPHIFDRYWNSDRHGSGLGLFIAESIVRAHGGRIWLDTSARVGATFCFTMPRLSPAQAVSTRKAVQDHALLRWLRHLRA